MAIGPPRIWRRLSFAHGRMFASFPPYRLATFVTPPSIFFMVLGMWLVDVTRPIVPIPYNGGSSTGAPVAASSPTNNQNQVNSVASGDYATCQSAGFSLTAGVGESIIAACSNIINGTAQGNGTMPADAALIGRAFGYRAVNNYTAAAADLTNVIKNEPNYTMAYYIRALTYGALQNNPAAQADAQKTISLQPNFWSAYGVKADAEFNQADYVDAIADSSTSILNNPQNTDANFVRGAAEARLNNYPAAIPDETAYLRNFPSDPAALAWRGFAEAFTPGDDNIAANDLNASLQNGRYAQAYDGLARLAFKQANYTAVQSDETQALAMQPNDILALNSRSGAEIRLNQYAAAQADAQSALNLNPTGNMLGGVYVNLGLAEFYQSDYADAAAMLEKGLEYEPNDQQLINTIAQAKQLAKTPGTSPHT